jgi:hypothetical protein
MQPEDAEINDLITQLKQLETPYSVGAWEDFEQFREQEEGKKRRILFYYRMAASFFVLLGFGLIFLFFNHSETVKKGAFISKKIPDKVLEKRSENQYSRHEINSIIPNKKTTKNNDSTLAYSGIYGGRTSKEQLPYSPRLKGNENEFTQIKNQNSTSNHGSRHFEGRLPSIPKFKESEFSGNSKLEIYEENITENKRLKLVSSIQFLFVKPPKLLKTRLNNFLIIKYLNDDSFAISDPIEKKKAVSKNQQLSVALIPQVNQMNQIYSPVNLGIGGFYKVSLSKKIAFVTGVQVGKQSINQQFEKITFNVATAGSPQPKSAVTDWWSVEIPAQVAWRLPYRINQAEVSIQTGISLAATTQKTTELTTENTRTIITKIENLFTGQIQEIVETKTEEITEVDTRNKQNFNTGVLLNFSVNFSYPVGQNWLSFEPYIKKPITDIAGENFRFLNTGVIIKWNFGKK